jgi:hypothetical protein
MNDIRALNRSLILSGISTTDKSFTNVFLSPSKRERYRACRNQPSAVPLCGCLQTILPWKMTIIKRPWARIGAAPKG